MKKTPDSVLCALMSTYPVLSACKDSIAAAIETTITSYRQGGTVYTCGNGGSAADADHIVGELMKGFVAKRPLPAADQAALRNGSGADGDYLASRLQCGLPAISLMTQLGLSTAVGNDLGADLGPAQLLYGMGRQGDVLIALSTSGNARNVALACAVARLKQMPVIGLTGAAGGCLAEWADTCIRVPERETYRVQELHLPVYHALCMAVEAYFFPE